MVNKKISSTPVSSGAISTPSVSVAGAVSTPSSVSGVSNTGVSSAGGGTVGGTATAGVAVPLKQPSKAFRKEITTVANGIGTQLPSGSAIVVNGQSISQASILTTLQAVLALYGNVDTTVQAEKSSRLVLQAALPVAHQFLVALKAALVGYFGKGNPALVAFGYSASKPRQLTAEQITARTAKAKATRELRGTLGSRQKLAVKFQGQVQVQTSLSGTQTGGGNPSPAGSSSAGATATPAASGNASGSGSTSSGT
jgi:hypothetical protein